MGPDETESSRQDSQEADTLGEEDLIAYKLKLCRQQRREEGVWWTGGLGARDLCREARGEG